VCVLEGEICVKSFLLEAIVNMNERKESEGRRDYEFIILGMRRRHLKKSRAC
jgi:hypothetical protein